MDAAARVAMGLAPAVVRTVIVARRAIAVVPAAMAIVRNVLATAAARAVMTARLNNAVNRPHHCRK